MMSRNLRLKKSQFKTNFFKTKTFVTTLLALLVHLPQAQARVIACSEGVGKILRLSGSNQLEAGCDFYGGFLFTSSSSSLDCQSSTLWGLAAADRPANLMTLSAADFGAAVDGGSINPLSDAITIESTSSAISDIAVKNCNIFAFKQAIKVKNALSGSRWLWTMAAQDPVLKGPVLDYVNTGSSAAKTNLLNSLQSYPWEQSALPDQIRAVTPHHVSFQNINVFLTSSSAVYVDHHVTDVNFDGLKVNRADGPGMYLEFGSRFNHITNSRFTNNSREGIAIDSSSDNIVENSYFGNNVGTDIALYRNCWEHFGDPGVIGTATERSNYFPRTQGSDRNQIIGNEFHGNGLNQKDANSGVSVASRQSVPANFGGDGCGLYKMAPAGNGVYYHKDRAQNVQIIGNWFVDVYQGVIVQDDGARVFGNRFEISTHIPVSIGTVIRTQATGLPVLDGRIAFNLIYRFIFPETFQLLIQVTEQRPQFSAEVRVCSTLGKGDPGSDYFGSLCSKDYLKILTDQGFISRFQPVVLTHMQEYY